MVTGAISAWHYILSYYSTNCHYAHIWSGSPQYLSSVHDRYPAIYVDKAAILKSEGVLAVFSRNLKTL